MSDIIYGIRITGDSEGAKRALSDTRAEQQKLSQAERDSTRAAADFERSFNIKTAAINRLRLAMLGAGAAAVAFGRSMLNAAVEGERSVARLGAVWRATGGTSGLSIAQHEDVAQRMARQTRFNDEQVRDAMAMLATFRQVSGETFVETMNIAASLAEVMNTDLKGAILQLGKALEDPVRGMSELRRVGVSFGPVQEEVIKKLVETGRQAEAMTTMLTALKEQGLDGVAEAMNQGMARSTSAFSKEWQDLLEALGRTGPVQGTVTTVLDSITTKISTLRGVVERGTWKERLAYALSSLPLLRAPFELANVGRVPEQQADPNSREAVGARAAAQAAQWQKSYDAQQAQIREFLKKYDEEQEKLAKAAAQDRNQVAADYAGSLQAQQDILDEARRLGVEFVKQEDAKREALEKEAQAVRDTISPWSAYAREVERLRKLHEQGLLTQREFSDAVALEARKVGGAVEEMGDRSVDTFNELRDAIEGWGQDISRELARGEVGLRSFARIAEEILAMQIQRRVMQPLLQAGTSWLDGLLAGSSSGSGHAYTGNAAPFHTGGIVGLEGGAQRYVHPAYFENARRMHSGGLAGDEVPAILRRGEGVFTREQMRAMGGGNLKINVINESGVPVRGETSAPRVDASGMAFDLVLRRLSTDGSARQQLKSVMNGPEH